MATRETDVGLAAVTETATGAGRAAVTETATGGGRAAVMVVVMPRVTGTGTGTGTEIVIVIVIVRGTVIVIVAGTASANATEGVIEVQCVCGVCVCVCSRPPIGGASAWREQRTHFYCCARRRWRKACTVGGLVGATYCYCTRARAHIAAADLCSLLVPSLPLQQ
jgi:hypothetical protein